MQCSIVEHLIRWTQARPRPLDAQRAPSSHACHLPRVRHAASGSHAVYGYALRAPRAVCRMCAAGGRRHVAGMGVRRQAWGSGSRDPNNPALWQRGWGDTKCTETKGAKTGQASILNRFVNAVYSMNLSLIKGVFKLLPDGDFSCECMGLNEEDIDKVSFTFTQATDDKLSTFTEVVVKPIYAFLLAFNEQLMASEMAKFERKFGLSPPEVKYTKEEILKMDTEEDLRDACEELDIEALVKSEVVRKGETEAQAHEGLRFGGHPRVDPRDHEASPRRPQKVQQEQALLQPRYAGR